MAQDLRSFIKALEEAGELKKIKTEVDWNLEMSHIAAANEQKKGPALVFENIKGCPDTSALMSAMVTPKRMAIALGQPTDSSLCELAQHWAEIKIKELIHAQEVDDGPVMENVVEGNDIDVNKFPAPFFHPQDGGRYIGTNASFVFKDPETGKIEVATQRMQILDGKSIGLNFMPGKKSEVALFKYKAMKKKMPAAIFIGCDPMIFLGGTVRIKGAKNIYDKVGSIRGETTEIVKTKLYGLPVPATAEMVFEGEVDPENYREEGPFGEYTGHYTDEIRRDELKPKPFLDVQLVMHRNNPILWATTLGRPVTDIHMLLGFMRTVGLWTELKMMRLPVKSAYMMPESCGRFWCVVSMKPKYPGQSQQVAAGVLATSTASYGTKGIIIVDEDIPADDLTAVFWALSVRYHPHRDTEILRRGRSTIADPSLEPSEMFITSRIIMDATVPHEWEEKPAMIKMNQDVMEKVKEKWSEYGLD